MEQSLLLLQGLEFEMFLQSLKAGNSTMEKKKKKKYGWNLTVNIDRSNSRQMQLQ